MSFSGPFKVAPFPFGAGDFAAGVGGEFVGEPPAAGNLPGGEFLGEEIGELRDRDFVLCVEGGDDRIGAVVTLDAEDDAFEDRGVRAEDCFDGFWSGFASCDVEEVVGAYVQVDEAIAE